MHASEAHGAVDGEPRPRGALIHRWAREVPWVGVAVLDFPQQPRVEARLLQPGDVAVARKVGKDLGDAGDGHGAVRREGQSPLSKGRADLLSVVHGFKVLAESAGPRAAVEINGGLGSADDVEVEALGLAPVVVVGIASPAVGEALVGGLGRPCLGRPCLGHIHRVWSEPNSTIRDESSRSWRVQPLSSMGSTDSKPPLSLARVTDPSCRSMQRYEILAVRI